MWLLTVFQNIYREMLNDVGCSHKGIWKYSKLHIKAQFVK